ncbi:MAG: IS66 family transposase [Verrucomicrobiia bacterium]
MSAPGEESWAEENRRLRQEIEALRLQRDTFESQNEALRLQRDTLETQKEALQSQADALRSQTEAFQIQIQELESIRRNLEHTVAVYKRCLFGSRSEKINPQELEARIAQAAAEAREQLAKEKRPGDPPPEAEEEQPEEQADTPADSTASPADKPADQEKEKKRKARPHGRGGFPAHLPRRRIEHPVDPAKAVCACCPDHPPLVQVGEDTCEKLVKLPVQYEVQVHVYPQMACQRCHEGVTSAPHQDNSLKADVSVIADVVVKKYLEHQPLYRQQQAFGRLDIPMSRQTLCDWTGWCSDQVDPVVRAMADYILSHSLVQSDETPVRMQLANGQMETARLWAYGLPWAEVVFDFRTDKSQDGPMEFLKGTKARFVQADGGSSYGPVFKELDLLHIACMAHIRRGIFEARADAPLAVDLLLAAIQKLYRIESRAKAMGLSLEARLQLRQREARPIFMELGQLIATLQKDVLPKSPLGRALQYAENQWPAMARYLEVAEAELDNNSTEHSLRGVVLGRRNWLHVGQESGGEKAANLFSLMITCKRLNVEPYAYLHAILQRLPSHPNKDIWQLTPRGWKETFAPKSPPPSPSG